MSPVLRAPPPAPFASKTRSPCRPSRRPSARATTDDLRIPGLVSPGEALSFLPAVTVTAAQATAVRNGARLPGGPPHPVRVVFRDELLAVYGPLDDEPGLRPLVIL